MTETASLSPQLAGFSGVPVTFQKFDPSLGKLSSIQIILQGTGQFTQLYENTAAHAASAQLHQSLDLILTLPNATHPLLDAHQIENHKYSAGSFDGAIDFGGISGDTGIYGVTASKQKILLSRDNLAMFTGSGLADVFLSTRAPFHISHSNGNSIREAEALAGANITIVYNYIPAPEPVAYGLFAGTLALSAQLLYFLLGHRRRGLI